MGQKWRKKRAHVHLLLLLKWFFLYKQTEEDIEEINRLKEIMYIIIKMVFFV